MKKLILAFLFINFNIVTFSQVIKGTVFEDETNNPVCYATVYFNGTFVGTISDQNGNFKLNTFRNKSMPVTVSAVGYYSVTLNDFSETDQLIVYLQPKIYKIKDVIISAKSLERQRRRNLRLFKKEFIGTTPNAQECEILNESDITFNYDTDNDTLKAHALNPILIENKALGYKITYYLDKFEFYKRNEATFFSGNFIFTEDMTTAEAQMELYKKSREFAYLGSRMHFLRELWSDNLRSSGFIIKSPSYEQLKFNDIVYQDENHNKFICYTSNILIEYKERKSTIEFMKDYVYFDESGFFNPGIKWSGDFGQQRISEWLPYEYSIEHNNR